MPSIPQIPAPVATRRPTEQRLHGETRIDDYAWLRDEDDPAVIAHLEAENAYAQAWLAPHAALTQRLYDEMLSRIQQDDEDVPYRKNGWWYSTRTLHGRQYPLYVRRRGSLDAPEEVILDMNALAEGKPFLQLGDIAVSPDGSRLAYSLDETGALDNTLYARDLASGEPLPVCIEKTDAIAWGNDSNTLYYLSKDEAKRTHRLWRHVIGAGTPDELLYQEDDELFWLSLGKTLDQRYLVLGADSKDTSEVRVLDADRADAMPRVVLPRVTGREYALDHRAGRFYLLVNDTGRNFRLVETDAAAPSLATARELIAHRPEVMLEDVELFARHMVVSERHRGVQKLRVWDFATGESHHIEFDEPVYSTESGDNAEFGTGSFRLEYSSFVTPHTVYDYELATRTLTLKKRQPVLGGYDPALYESRQVSATASDGTAVPVSLVWRRDRQRAGTPQPLLLYGYGSYGSAMDVHFSSSRVSLLDRGVVYAIAHVRGGGDLGRTWYDDGKLARKMNTFTDFIACAETLIAQGWTTPAQLIIEGGSAGGLLTGAVTNLRPELFNAVVAEVPFVDVINTMLDETLPLTVGEYLEWGNPKLAADYAVMRSYSPYDNLKPGAYPAIYMRTSIHDSQVPYWESAKYVARLRMLKTDDNPVLLITNLDAGHGGASGRYDALRERAEDFTFMLVRWKLGA